MATARGTRDVPVGREVVWTALSRPTTYCSVCDVSYVFDIAEADAGQGLGLGSRFVCVSGQLDGAQPPPGAMDGEILEWVEGRRIGTRLTRGSETWETRIELEEVEQGSTRVTITVTQGPGSDGRPPGVLRRRVVRQMVQRTVDSELAKLPDHINQVHVAQVHVAPIPVAPVRVGPVADDRTAVIVVQREGAGLVLHLQGEVDAAAVRRLQLGARLTEETVVAIDVTGLTYLDSAALVPLLRWARAVSRNGRPATARGANLEFDRMLDVMGMTSVFIRRD